MNIFELTRHGFAASELALGMVQATMGAFFACSGWNKLTNKARHAALVDTLRKDHVPRLGFTQWWVPGWELAGGLMLLVGVMPAFAAGVLSVICMVACVSEARGRVAAYQPINKADTVADWLYLPEVLYLVALVAVVLGGGYNIM